MYNLILHSVNVQDWCWLLSTSSSPSQLQGTEAKRSRAIRDGGEGQRHVSLVQQQVDSPTADVEIVSDDHVQEDSRIKSKTLEQWVLASAGSEAGRSGRWMGEEMTQSLVVEMMNLPNFWHRGRLAAEENVSRWKAKIKTWDGASGLSFHVSIASPLDTNELEDSLLWTWACLRFLNLLIYQSVMAEEKSADGFLPSSSSSPPHHLHHCIIECNVLLKTRGKMTVSMIITEMMPMTIGIQLPNQEAA